MMLLLAWAAAFADSATTLPGGSAVVYGGAGVNTFQYGSSGLIRDRQWRLRADFYGAVGLSERAQLSLDGPFVQTFVQDLGDRGPCPSDAYEGDYCDPVTTAGEVGLTGRYALSRDTVKSVVELGVRTDAWNAGTRGRWTNAGLGTTSLVGGLLGEAHRTWEGVDIGVVAGARYRLVAGRDVDAGLGAERLPGDAVHGVVELSARSGRTTGQLGLSGMSRLAGVEFGPDYVDYYRLTQDRWASLRYRELRGEAKLSRALSDNAGVHLTVGRVLVARNGPRDALDVSLGVHRYFPPGG